MEVKEDVSRDTFKNSLPIQIRFNDIDTLGHINNNVYFSYFDLGKIHYLESLRTSCVSWTDGILVIARIEVDFVAPVFYKEKIAVDTKVIKVGNKSVVFVQQIRNVLTNELKCICHSTGVAYNPQSRQSIPIPDIWRRTMTEFDSIKLETVS